MESEARYKEMTSDHGLRVEVSDDEAIIVRGNADGTITIESALSRDYGGPGKFEIGGLDLKEASEKTAYFWKNLWNKIKSAAAAALDAVTVPVFGYRCRPDIKVDVKGRGIVIGIACHEA